MRITECTHPSYFVVDGRTLHESSLAVLTARNLLENADEVETFRGEFLRDQAFALRGADAVAKLGENAFYSIDDGGGITAGKEFAFDDFAIPDGVKIVRKSAFRGIQCLVSVEIPSSVETIEEDAFNGCTNLRDVKLSYGLLSIQHRAFSGTAIDEPIRIPASVTQISPRNTFPNSPRYAIVDRDLPGDCCAALGRCGLRLKYS